MLLAPAREVIRPAFLTVPASAVGNRGDDVADLAAALGQEVGPEERIALGALTPVRADGRCAGLAGCIVCGRRNVKSWAMEMCAFDDGWVLETPRIMWSAHLFSTTVETFNHMKQLILNYDFLRRRVHKVRDANGEEGFDFVHGGRMDFVARQKGKTGRGRDVDRLYLDEWLYGTEQMLGAMLPTMAASKDPYVRFGTSPGMPHSEAARALRERGRSGCDESLSYVEWTVETRDAEGRTVVPACADPGCEHRGNAVGCISDDVGLIASANPAYGRRIPVEFVRQERMNLPPPEFRRERLGIWEDPEPDAVDEVDDTLANWPGCEDADAAPGDPVALGVDVSHNGRSASIVACGLGADGGGPVVEVVEFRRTGTGWVAGRLAELVERHHPVGVGVAKGSPADGLRLDGVTVVPSVETAGACASFARAVQDGRLRHRGQVSMAIAVAAAVRVMAGDVWRWSRRLSKSADISPLMAAVVALHVLETVEPEEPYDPLANFMPNL